MFISHTNNIKKVKFFNIKLLSNRSLVLPIIYLFKSLSHPKTEDGERDTDQHEAMGKFLKSVVKLKEPHYNTDYQHHTYLLNYVKSR